MKDQYKTLLIAYSMVKDKHNPLECRCKPIEITLRQFESNYKIIQNLKLLEEEGFVRIFREKNITFFSITKKGIRAIIETEEFKVEL